MTILAWSVAVFAQDARERSSPEEREALRTMYSPASIDEVFDTPDVTTILAGVRQVRLFRAPVPVTGDDISFYSHLEKPETLQARLAANTRVSIVPPDVARPLLNLALDYTNYGNRTACDFGPGLAVVIGDDEPAYVLVCCFTCHDVHVIRRPSKDRPGLHVSKISMSPDLELAILPLAQKAFPEDEDLQHVELRVQGRFKSFKARREDSEKRRELSEKPKK